MNNADKNKTTFILYANASSLLDHTNGASKSVRLILEELANHKCTVHAVMGCTSDCKEGFKNNQAIWLEQKHNKGKLRRFTKNRVQYSLIATEHWSRQYLAADEQELIYRESQELIDLAARSFTQKIIIGWGNLLLEESLFKYAKENGFRIHFYLANPTYKDKNVPTLDMATSIFTDSKATKDLYSNDLIGKITILPKCIEPPTIQQNAEHRWEQQTIIFVNPKPKKGVEALIAIAYYLHTRRPHIKIRVVDPGDKFDKSLEQLQINKNKLPPNINIVGGFPDTDYLLSDISCLLLLSLWHESGSRLIYECHLRGVPVIGFSTGGTTELLRQFSNDLFPRPTTKIEKSTIRICSWDSSPIAERIIQLLSDIECYKHHHKKILEQSKKLYANNTNAANIILGNTDKIDQSVSD
tara:strand:+ start:7605 stop:8840 length:1236 start_codon:yes stop_codon:yes gene_type:complete